MLFGLYRYGWKADVAGLTLGLVGVWAMVVQVFLVGRVIKKIGEVNTMMLGLACGGLGFGLYALAPTAWAFWLSMPIAALMGFLNPAVMALATREIGPTQQGQLQGALGAVQAATSILDL
ncbi:MAG: TCR/Tet family MFS transporter [Hyphomonadaceae bacterium]|nr:TCR/Tet family MFS transporter [Hyphomonadaceae bacterium]